ncbi:PqqD family protein [Citreimonas sp.]|uniref:PqqD family protein n=1 Tax=Citreimonas sp. TaxID=3036715 RepID=UPI004059DB21
MQKFEPTTMLRASGDCVVREISGEMMLLNLRNGTYYGLDQTGTRVWSLIAEGATFGAVVQDLHDRTGAPADRIAADLQVFLGDLAAHDLVEVNVTADGAR